MVIFCIFLMCSHIKGFAIYIFVKIIIEIAKQMQLVQDNSQVGNS